jgi:hypothetical protein
MEPETISTSVVRGMSFQPVDWDVLVELAMRFLDELYMATLTLPEAMAMFTPMDLSLPWSIAVMETL